MYLTRARLWNVLFYHVMHTLQDVLPAAISSCSGLIRRSAVRTCISTTSNSVRAPKYYIRNSSYLVYIGHITTLSGQNY
jgi:hypothetical protein